MTAFNGNGSVAGATTISVPANGTALVQVSELSAATGFGSVRIAAPQKPGTIVANITTLSGVTGLSFDAPFARELGRFHGDAGAWFRQNLVRAVAGGVVSTIRELYNVVD